MGDLTKADIFAINNLPDGWFELGDVPHTISRPEYRLNRLEESGHIETKHKRECPKNGTRREILDWLHEGKLYRKTMF